MDEDANEGKGSKEINKAQYLLSKGIHNPMRDGRKGGGKGKCCRCADSCIFDNTNR